jgi:hypothetical protein
MMLLSGAIYIVDRHVRLYDVDGTFVEILAEDMVDFVEPWIKQWRERLLEIKRQEEKRRKES